MRLLRMVINVLTVYKFIAMSKKITTNLSLSQPEHTNFSSALYHKQTNRIPFMFSSTTSNQRHSNLAYNKLRIKTAEMSIDSPKVNAVSIPLSLWTPKRAKRMTSDLELRQTQDSLQQFYKKMRIKIKDFLFLKMLGKGKHGVVYLAMHKKTGFIGALKIFFKEDFHSESTYQKKHLQQMLIKELKIQSYLSHNHVLKVYSIFCDEKCLYLFMELGSDGQLLDLLQRKKAINEQAISFILRSLLQAIKYLHSSNILHRDIKPQNVVLIHGFPKICDFGESTVCNLKQGELRETLCGTPLYLSPQILKGELYDEKVDIWALGAMGFQLFTGENPFNVKTKEQLKRVVTQNFLMTVGSVEFRNFLSYCLRKNASQRPSADKLLRHPFIRKWVELQTSQYLCD